VKLNPISDGAGQVRGYAFFCPGCGDAHVFYTLGQTVWSFNNNQENPTFTPSLLNTCPNHPDQKQRRCHLNLTEGKLQFHSDCTHDHAGKLVDLPEWTLDWT
jgi:hypothetical protein